MSDVIIHPCPKFNGGWINPLLSITQPPLMSEHGWAITLHCFTWMYILIHAISVIQIGPRCLVRVKAIHDPTLNNFQLITKYEYEMFYNAKMTMKCHFSRPLVQVFKSHNCFGDADDNWFRFYRRTSSTVFFSTTTYDSGAKFILKGLLIPQKLQANHTVNLDSVVERHLVK